MAQSQTDTELLTEHLGYAPVSLLDSIINVVNSLADKTLDRLEQGLSGATPKTLGFEKALRKQQQARSNNGEPLPTAEEAASFEVADGVHKLETLLCNAIDKNFDLFELYIMNNIVCVHPNARPWIRLQHYGGLDFEAATSAEAAARNNPEAVAAADAQASAPSSDSVNAVRRKLQGSRRLNVMLQAEHARNEALLEKLRAVIGGKGAPSLHPTRVKSEAEGADGEPAKAPFAFLHERGDLTDADARTPLTTTTAFTVSQLQALRALSTSLGNILPDLAAPPGAEGDGAAADEGRKGWRRERVEYVEGQTRKHLEKVRGLELGDNGEVRDGEWQGEGREFASGEAQGMEQVVTLLGGAPGGTSFRAEDAGEGT